MTASATAPCALSHPLPLSRWASETQGPPPSPGHPPHTLHCSTPSAGTHAAKTRRQLSTGWRALGKLSTPSFNVDSALRRPKTRETAASQLPSDEKINPSLSVAFLLLCFDRFHPAGTTSPSLCQGPNGGCPHPQWWSPSPMPETCNPLSL